MVLLHKRNAAVTPAKKELEKNTKKHTNTPKKNTKPAKIADMPAHESDKNDDKMYFGRIGTCRSKYVCL